MWNILLGLIERWWREKPRLDLARAIVELRDAMTESQDCYRAHYEAMELASESIKSMLPKLYSDWQSTTKRYGSALSDLDTVLSIYDPKLLDSLNYYGEVEWEMQKHWDSFRNITLMLEGEPEVSVENLQIEVGFSDALDRLNAFIRANFKPEEIDALRRSRLR